MRWCKLTFLLLLASLVARSQFVQPMNYPHYSFPGSVNIGSGKVKITNQGAYLEIGDSLYSRKGILFPRGNKDSVINLSKGLLLFDRPTNRPWYFDGQNWVPWGVSNISICDESWQGGIVTNRNELTFDISPSAFFHLNCQQYSSPGGTITLPANDTLDQYFRFVINIDGTVGYIAGVPAENPLIPGFNAATQWDRGYVLVHANGTIDVSNLVIFNENAEWTTSSGGVISVNFNYTSKHFVDAISAAIASHGNGAYIDFAADHSYFINNYNILFFWTYLSQPWSAGENLLAQFYNDSTPRSNAVAAPVAKTDTGGWRLVALDLSQFKYEANDFNKLRFWLTGSSSNPFYIDYLQLQKTEILPTGGTGGGGGPGDGYKIITNGITSAVAGTDRTFKIYAADTSADVDVRANDPTHGNSAGIKVNQDKLRVDVSQVNNLRSILDKVMVRSYNHGDTLTYVLGDSSHVDFYNNRIYYDSRYFTVSGDTVTLRDDSVGRTEADPLSVHLSDSASMLSKYLRKADTATLSNRIDLKLNISDTAAMLANYRHWLAGYITKTVADGYYVSLSGSYANPSWITSLAWSKITGTPTTLAGYGITDAFNGDYNNLTNKPTIPTNNNQLTNGSGFLTLETDPKRLTGLVVTGTTNKTITATLADASTVTTTFTDLSSSGGGGIDSVRKATGSDTVKQYSGGTGTFAFRVLRKFNVKDYDPNAGTKGYDAVPAVQAAANAAAAAGGTIYFPNGYYTFSSPLVTSVNGTNPNSQIYVKSVWATDTARTHILFEGESMPNYTPAMLYVDTSFAPTGVIIESTIDGTGNMPAVFGSAPLPGKPYNYNYVSFKNLTIVVKANTTTTGPTMSGINAQRAASLQVDNCVIMTNGSLMKDTIPQTETFGIITPAYAGETMTSMRNTMVEGGFKHGYVVGEHNVLDNLNSFGNWYGFTFQTSDHGIDARRLLSQWNKHDVYIPNSTLFGITPRQSRFHIGQLDIEEWDPVSSGAATRWFNSTRHILDSGNRGYGDVLFNIIKNNGATVSTLNMHGGSNIFIRPENNPAIFPANLYISRSQSSIYGLHLVDSINATYKGFAAGDGGIFYTRGSNKFGIQNESGSLIFGASGTSTPQLTVNTAGIDVVASSGNAAASFQGASGNTVVSIKSGASTNPSMVYVVGGANKWYMQTVGSNDNFNLLSGDANGNNSRFTITQTGNVGLSNSSPNAAALLDLTSTSKGLLLPRMTKAQRDAISSPPDGLAVYQTDNTPGLRVRENGVWVKYTSTAD